MRFSQSEVVLLSNLQTFKEKDRIILLRMVGEYGPDMPTSDLSGRSK